MIFTGNENHGIQLEEAAALTRHYRDAELNESNGGYFGRVAIESILRQDGCVGIRYYFAIGDGDVLKVVLVGVNGDGNDLVDGQLAEFSTACPEICGDANKLNSNQD